MRIAPVSDAKARSAQLAQRMLSLGEKLASGATLLSNMSKAHDGCTAFERVFQSASTTLRHYQSPASRQETLPILIVYALVNRPYMLDLTPKRSFIRALLERGRTVYLVDWGYAQASDRDRTLEDYVLHDLGACIAHVLERHQVPRLDLLGVCQGGTFSLCQAGLEPKRINSLTLMVTPVDFSCPEFLLARWLEHVDIEAMVSRLGNVPGQMLNAAFMALKPFSLTNLKALELLQIMDQPAQLQAYARMEHWLNDCPDQAGHAFAQYCEHVVRNNALFEGTFSLADSLIRLDQVASPVLNIYARNDHIVPPSSSRALAAHMSHRDYTELAFDGGHIGLFASRHAQANVPNAIDKWLDAHAYQFAKEESRWLTNH